MYSKRIRQMTPSATSELMADVQKMKADGHDVISLNAGEPDFPTPGKITEACKKALEEGKTKYAPIPGIIPLRKSICKKLKRDNNADYEPLQICVSTGAKQALFNAIMALIDPGDEVIIPTPCWVSYVEMVKFAHGIPILVSTDPDFSLNIKAIRDAVTPSTKAIIINTPNNPTGAVYSEHSLKQLGELAASDDFYIISDEVYEKLVYDKNKHICCASLSSEIYDHTIVINGVSKAYSMTGWRLGYSAAPKDIAAGLASFQGHVTFNSTTFVQWAAITALSECADEVESMHREFEKRRNFMYKELTAIPDVDCVMPGGAFYFMPDISAYYGKTSPDGKIIRDSAALCDYLLKNAEVAVVPGSAFYMPATIRIAYSNSMDNLKRGIEAISKALKELK